VAADESVLMRGRDVFLLRKVLERFEHAAAGLPSGFEKFQAGLIRSGLLRTPFAQQRAKQHLLPAHHHAAARAAHIARRVAGDRPTYHHPDAEHHEQQRFGLIAGNARTERRHVAAGDVPRLMCDNADDLVRRLCLEKRACI
jgi:hypothetical protein